MKHEIRELLRRISNSRKTVYNVDTPNIVSDYNNLLERLQQKYPNNPLIQQKIPVDYQPFFGDQIDEIEQNCKMFLENLSEEPVIPQGNININIGTMQGNLSFENIISTIQNSNIGNRTEIIDSINEFKSELQKSEPNKTKLKAILTKLESLGSGVIASLLVEAGKKFLGL